MFLHPIRFQYGVDEFDWRETPAEMVEQASQALVGLEPEENITLLNWNPVSQLLHLWV